MVYFSTQLLPSFTLNCTILAFNINNNINIFQLMWVCLDVVYVGKRETQLCTPQNIDIQLLMYSLRLNNQ